MRARIFRSILLAVTLAGVTCLMPAQASASRVLGLLSPSVRYSLDPGDSVSGTVVAVNDGDEPAIVYVYAASQRFNRHGAVDYYTASGDDVSASESATWIHLTLPIGELPPADQPSVMLEPGQRLSVDYTINVPRDASPGDHSIIVFFEIRDDGSSGGKTAGVTGRLGARIKLRTSGDIVRRMGIDPFNVPSCIIGDVVPYDFVLRNTGNVDASTTVTMDVIGRKNRLESSAVIASQTVSYARSVIEGKGKTTLPRNALGFYTLRLVASADWGESGQPGETSKERAVFAIPLWLVIALIVLAVLIQLRIWWNVNERKRRQKLAQRRKRRAEARAAAELGTAPPPAGDESESV